ncbi:MAG: cell division ATP-binding protein FtsE [Panacagrimonas sp.]
MSATALSTSENILEFKDVGYRYSGGVDVVSELSFNLRRGEMLFLTGPSGAGKSTVLRLAALQMQATRGRVSMNGRNLAEVRPGRVPAYRRELGLIFQDFQLLHDRSVFDNVALPMVIRGMTHVEASRRVRAALDSVGLLEREHQLPRRLSGGEQQRVGIARAIVARPALILADEPTGNLDPRMALEIMRLFERFNETGVSLMIASHAIDLIEGLGHRLIHLNGGRASAARPDSASRLTQRRG